MNRRNFIKISALAASLPAFPTLARASTDALPDAAASPVFAPSSDAGWRQFEVSTHVQPQRADGIVRA